MGGAALSSSKRRTVLVTGGAGFLGIPVVRRLRLLGHPVAVLDDGSAGTLPRLTVFADDPGVRVHRADVADAVAVGRVCARERPWGVAHLAARHFLPDCERTPDSTWRVNTEGTRALLQALAAHPPKRFLLASTADVYAPSDRPHREDDAIGPHTAYGRSKRAAELLAEEACAALGCRCTVARLFNLYGPFPTVRHLIASVLSQAALGDRLALGDLHTVRDYVYVEDAADAVVALLCQGNGGTVNVGTGTATRGHEVVALVSALLGRTLVTSVDAARLRAADRPSLVAATGRLAAVLPRWSATALREGLARSIREQRAAASPGPYPG